MLRIRFIISKILRKCLNPPAINRSVLASFAKVDIGSSVSDTLLGRYSYAGAHTTLVYAEVGNFTSISNFCAIGGGNHPVDWVSSSPVFNRSRSIVKEKLAQNDYQPYTITYIGHDVWIGSHCLVKAGVTIGSGAVIGMGSVVTKDVGPYEIWAGNPAKLIRKRFDDDTISRLSELAWWNWPDEKIRRYADLFNTPEAFLKKVESEADNS